MIFRFSFFSLIFSVAVTALLTSCSDSEIGPSDVPVITQAIYVVPENFYGEPYTRYVSSDNFYVKINEKIKICGIYIVNKDTIPIDLSTPYYISHKWTIDDNEAFASVVYYNFDKVGVHNITFETIDLLGDTLTSHAKIYVNTPISVALQSPSNKYNLVDGDNPNGLELSWRVYGIDPWESSACFLYATYDKDSVWNKSLGEIDCSINVDLIDTLDMKYNYHGDSINHSIDNSTIYWGVRAITQNERGQLEQAYSEVFEFSTKLKNDGKAIIEIPVICKYNQYPEKSQLKGVFISATGDTLSKISDISGNAIIRETLTPQSNMKFLVCDVGRTEYGCDSLTVDLAPSTKTRTDTLFLQDKVRPNMIPTETSLSTLSPLRFIILDNGSGVNESKIIATMNGDTLETKMEDFILSIPNHCKNECKLFINAEDYAQNKVPYIYWIINVNKAETTIQGPFFKPEDD